MSDKKKTRNNNIQKEKLPPYLIVMGAVCVVMAVITIIVSVVMAQREPIVEFIPPVFETDAVTGIHDISEIVECADIDADELCDDCGYELPHDHDWSSEWSADTNHHWNDCTYVDCPLTDNSQKNEYAAHDFEFIPVDVSEHSGVCTICGESVFFSHDELIYSEVEGDETTHTELCITCGFSEIKSHELSDQQYDDTHH